MASQQLTESLAAKIHGLIVKVEQTVRFNKTKYCVNGVNSHQAASFSSPWRAEGSATSFGLTS